MFQKKAKEAKKKEKKLSCMQSESANIFHLKNEISK